MRVRKCYDLKREKDESGLVELFEQKVAFQLKIIKKYRSTCYFIRTSVLKILSQPFLELNAHKKSAIALTEQLL